MNFIWGFVNMVKVMVGGFLFFDKLYNVVCGFWFSCLMSKDEGWV